MKIADCTHLPSEFAQPQADHCQEGDASPSLRVCLTCGHVGCCDSSPSQHARKHAAQTGHQVMASYPADKSSFIWCYVDDDYLDSDESTHL